MGEYLRAVKSMLCLFICGLISCCVFTEPFQGPNCCPPPPRSCFAMLHQIFIPVRLPLTGVTTAGTETVMNGPRTETVTEIGTGTVTEAGIWSRLGFPTCQLQAAEPSSGKTPYSSKSTPSPTCPTRHATTRSSRSGCSCLSGSTERASPTSWCGTSLLCWWERLAPGRPHR